jgi:DNA invertase Pin-like site-specific DNA recombinase
MFRAGLCAYVFTNDQQTLAMQSHAKREFAAPRRVDRCDAVREVSSGAAQRQAREKSREAARGREIDAVLVWRLDRWGRPGNRLASNDALWGQSGSATKARCHWSMAANLTARGRK